MMNEVDFNGEELESMVQEYIAAGNAANYSPSILSGSASDPARDKRLQNAAENWVEFLGINYRKYFKINFSKPDNSPPGADNNEPGAEASEVNLESASSVCTSKSWKKIVEEKVEVMKPPPASPVFPDQPYSFDAICKAFEEWEKSKKTIAQEKVDVMEPPPASPYPVFADQPCSFDATCQAFQEWEKSKKQQENPAKKS